MNVTETAPKKINVKLEAHLFEMGEPLVSLFSKKAGKGIQHFIGTAIPDEDGGTDFYFVVFVGRKHFIRYFSEQCDLRFLFAFASGRKYYKAKSLVPSTKSGLIEFEEFGDQLSENLFPDPQFFASAHTSNYGSFDLIGDDQRLLIDGQWDMQDFGLFYQKFADLYSYKQAVDYVASENSTKVDKVQKVFKSKPFRGGSSYVGFFNELQDLIPRNERPALNGIEYHSPGYVELRGKSSILESLKQSIEIYLENADEIQKCHDDLRGFMSKNSLLRITGASKSVEVTVLADLADLTKSFLSSLPLDGKDYIDTLTKENPVVRAKIGLALFRRLKATATFFAQGRLSYPETLLS